jgi:hypothetical protein
LKKDILCVGCAKAAKDLFPKDKPYPGENVRFVHGRAKAQYHCDHCFQSIHPTDHACAFTIFLDGEYPEWETEYLTAI